MNIPVRDLIAQFEMMYREHWSYKWGRSERGCVDCSGAFTYVFGQYGISCPHGSNSIARTFIDGDILPTIYAEPGMVAFKVRPWREEDSGNKWYEQTPGDVYHVGLVDEDTRYVLNAKSEKTGFSRDKLSDWDYVAFLRGVDYSGDASEEGTEPVQEKKPTIRKGDSGPYVTLAQTQLIQKGYSCGDKGADGIFGNDTLKAVKAFQQDQGLKADGIVGQNTWAALDSSTQTVLYTVFVPGLQASQADALIAQYPGSWKERG